MALNLKTITAALLLSATALSFSAPAHALDDAQKKEFGAFIKEYLIANPEIMLEVQEALEAKQSVARASQAESAVADNKQALFSSPDDLSIGNPKGDVTIVEFFDYNCGYCKRAMGDMDELLAKDKNLRLVLKEFPILGPDSVAAHTVSDAVRKLAPEKYGEFQRTLLGGTEHADEANAMALAVTLGLKEADVRKKMADSPNERSVKEAYQLATVIGISGTPSYIVGNEAVFGAVGAGPLEEKIANIRTCGKASCS
jgi:protein-disulfide isomerase